MPEIERRRALWLEVAALVLWDPLSSFASGVFTSRAHQRTLNWGVNLEWLITSLGRAAIVLFIVWNSGDPLEHFGFRKLKLRDLLLAILLFAAVYVCFSLPLHVRTEWIGFRPTLMIDRYGVLFVAFTVISLVCGSFFEELLFRGVFITRLEELSGNVWIAVLVSAVLFAIVHAYQSGFGMFKAFAIGLLYGITFARTRSLWPTTIAHTLTNAAIYLYL